MAATLKPTADVETGWYIGDNIVDFNVSAGELKQCGYRHGIHSKSTWQVVNPLLEAAPTLTQLGLMIFCIRALFLLFEMARLPRFLAELVSALVMGASGIGQIEWFSIFLTPMVQNQAFETLATLGLVYYMFLVGLEMDLTSLARIEKKVFYNAAAGIVIPMAFGYALCEMIFNMSGDIIKSNLFGSVFVGVAMSVTSFPDLARILSDLKILNTDVGRMALSSAFINDLVIWVFVVGAMAYKNAMGDVFFAVPTVIFLLTCWFVIRPILAWKIPNIRSHGGDYTDGHVYCVFVGVLVFGFMTDICGTHSMVGAFIFGLIMPNGELVSRVSEKLEEFVTGILLPLFFVLVGYRNNIVLVPMYPKHLGIVIAVAWWAKVVTAFTVATLYGMSIRESFTLGVLMNTKGILAIIVLSVGVELKALHIQVGVTILVVFMALTITVKPIPFLIYNPTNRFKAYNQRTVESVTVGSEFRVLLCIHSIHNMAGLTTLLEYSNSTKQSPIVVLAAHLVELSGRATAMLIVHGSRQNAMDDEHRTNCDKDKADLIIKALEEFESNGRVGCVQVLTVVSPYDTMHEDIANLSEDKFANLILMSVNKPSAAEGMFMTEEASYIRKVCQNLLKKAPCSVALLLDRGLGLARNKDDEDDMGRQQLHVVMFFCGGPDSREALAYSYKMAGCPDVDLTVVRFIPGREAEDMVEEIIDFQTEQALDDRFVNEFKFRTMSDSSIVYTEKIVNAGDEILEAITDLFDDYHLCIVGRGQGVIKPFTMGLAEWIECEELGALGDILSTSRFAERASILVIQKYET